MNFHVSMIKDPECSDPALTKSCYDKKWESILEVGKAMNTDGFLEKTSEEKYKWTQERSLLIAKTVLLSLKGAEGAVG